MKDAPLILLAAGGTGGHLFPAEALAHALRACGARTALATDGRAAGFGEGFPAEARFAFKAATPSGRSPLGMAKAGATLLAGALAARAALAKLKPDAVIGFGGYPCVPPVLAATWSKIPSALHEQNAVMGRANRFLAARVDAIATGFPELGGVGADVRAKATHVGNPVRPAVIEAAKVAYVPPGDGPIRLVVTGGSQGARVMSDVPPAAIAA
ncbi:MAG: glycosyltransferase, partial [Hyphomicrobiales bacterium]|nr:glycosyltransferase [Hyphomicrobiales bacterium]